MTHARQVRLVVFVFLTCLAALFCAPVAPAVAAVLPGPSTAEEIALARDIQLYKEILELNPSESLVLDAWYTFVQKYPDIAQGVHYRDIDALEARAFGQPEAPAPAPLPTNTPPPAQAAASLDGLIGDWKLKWRGKVSYFSLDAIRPNKSLDYSLHGGLNFGNIHCRDYKAELVGEAIVISVRCKSRRMAEAVSAPDVYTIRLNFKDGRFTRGHARGGSGLDTPVEIIPD